MVLTPPKSMTEVVVIVTSLIGSASIVAIHGVATKKWYVAKTKKAELDAINASVDAALQNAEEGTGVLDSVPGMPVVGESQLPEDFVLWKELPGAGSMK